MPRQTEDQKLDFEITLPDGVKLRAIRINGRPIQNPDGEPCWCRHPAENRIHRIYAIAPKGGPVGYDIKFCPACGRRVT